MYLKTVPFFLRWTLPSNLEWKIPSSSKELFITFDDGPIPEVTPWVLETLDKFNAKATFFCVGDNVAKYPDIYNLLLEKGHATGNHTFHHLKAWKTSFEEYMRNIDRTEELMQSTLFRPPHGQITYRIAKALKERYRIIMWSVLSRDFDKSVTPQECLDITLKNSRTGSIIVFHDSLKAKENLAFVLPRFLEYFSDKGYSFPVI